VRKWGILVSAFYALILLAVIVPAGLAIWLGPANLSKWLQAVGDLYTGWQAWEAWVVIGGILASQALLLFLSVDTSQKRLRPRSNVLTSCIAAAFLTALLTSAVVWSVGFAARGDEAWKRIFDQDREVFAFWGGLWVVWGVIFYLYLRNSSDAVTRVMSWLLKGSVLELLIVVPCHIIVRRRHDCSAPMATSFGIATGVAVMLLCFGPSVLFLYKKRLDASATRTAGSQSA
jgi:hypothetical protein